VKIDIDRATADEIDDLPGIGRVIAKRIIADRDSSGPFGCLKALETVKGIGPALARKLDSLVTFSGPSTRDVKLCYQSSILAPDSPLPLFTMLSTSRFGGSHTAVSSPTHVRRGPPSSQWRISGLPRLASRR
jgi:competence ComEA-like helix-hairpin-helix protein